MRPSSRDAVLDAALRVARRDGLSAVTFDSVARESGLSRGGVMYHFDTKDALLEQMHAHSAAAWESQLIALLDRDVEDSTPADRLHAYLQASIDPVTPRDLSLVMEASADAEDGSAALQVANRWAPDLMTPPTTRDELDALVARLASDGLWVFAALTGQSLPAEVLDAVLARIRELIEPPAGPGS
ncbi:hypothetical protein BHE97_08230 [Aeromicrobium sp. PE09-221]|uniref:TetR/AcrR family transcriptional regulator n=1 Tax=Aeromicrobium sp. PE09-221 TaxID=1898043 RepID=UPI000B6BA499|nr:TetR/AcrR family transcriptional regulator [Aeromicrobium sp. PE09-221]OUZ10319.1 hypothetical protein BHE97_08230 [Aeromicrobium sp. PE09-221]